MSRPNSCPVTKEGVLSLQCFRIFRTASPSSCTFLSGDESDFLSIAAAKFIGAPSPAILSIGTEDRRTIATLEKGRCNKPPALPCACPSTRQDSKQAIVAREFCHNGEGSKGLVRPEQEKAPDLGTAGIHA